VRGCHIPSRGGFSDPDSVDEDLPPESMASRRAVARWSDGTEGEALGWYADEVRVGEGELIGKTHAELRSLQLRRDHDWLQS
jgi:hypothetical protein